MSYHKLTLSTHTFKFSREHAYSLKHPCAVLQYFPGYSASARFQPGAKHDKFLGSLRHQGPQHV